MPSKNGSWRTSTAPVAGCRRRYVTWRSNFSGNHTSSWSQSATSSPDAKSSPAFRAAATPARACRWTIPRPSAAMNASATAALSSTDPSSTTITSVARYVCAEIASRASPRKRSPLWTGTITLTSVGTVRRYSPAVCDVFLSALLIDHPFADDEGLLFTAHRSVTAGDTRAPRPGLVPTS